MTANENKNDKKQEFVIDLSGLQKSYGKKKALDGLDLQVRPGQIYGFIGPNGAGKSTTIRILMQLAGKDGGMVRLFGRDLEKKDASRLAEIGYLPSETTFYPGMKAKDVIRLSAGFRKKNCADRAKELCRRLQVDLNEKTENLSLGNRKKVGIVCALQHEPALIILDEPTSGLDPLIQKELFSILKEEAARGKTVFLSSHNLKEVEQYCDEAALIRDGRIIHSGRISDFLNGTVRKITLKGKADLNGLQGIRSLRPEGDLQSFLYDGSLNALLRRLSEGQIEDLIVEEPDLEEVFLHFYQDPAGTANSLQERIDH